MKNSNIHNLHRIWIVMLTLIGYHAFIIFSNNYHPSNYDQRIEHLLAQHELCEEGVINPDSAVFFSTQALSLIDSCFGRDNERYVDVFTDYFIDDVKKYKDIIFDIASLVDITFNCKFEGTRRAYSKLAGILSGFDNDPLTARFFELAIDYPINDFEKVKSQIRFAKYLADKRNSGLEEQLDKISNSIYNLPSPEKETVILLKNRFLLDYFSKQEEEKGETYISEADPLINEASPNYAILYLASKYHYLLLTNHSRALSALEKAIEIAEQNLMNKTDKERLASLLITKGDYFMNQAIDTDYAMDSYKRALELLMEPNAAFSREFQMLARSIMHILIMGGEWEDAINLGEALIPIIVRDAHSSEGGFEILELCKAYKGNCQFEKAETMMEIHNNRILVNPRIQEKATCLKAEIAIAKEDYSEALNILKELETSNPKIDTQIWIPRYLALVYSHLDRNEKYIYADKVNHLTKRIIASQFWHITPALRKRWLELCNESVKTLLSCPDNQKAIKSAAELNLFRKSLLFRTSSEMEKLAASLPKGKLIIDSIKSLKRELLNPAPDLDRTHLKRELDDKENELAYLFMDKDKLLGRIDVEIDSVSIKYDSRSALVDFIDLSIHGNSTIGAFIYSQNLQPTYVEIYNGLSQGIPENPRMFWSPILPFLNDFDKIYFCTDSFLNSFPIEYSVIKDGKRICDLFELHRLFHPANKNDNIYPGDKIEFWGVSDHNSPPKRKPKVSRKDWTDLTQIDVELNALKSHLGARKVRAFINDEATEENFSRFDHSTTSLLHIYTHGLFLTRDSIEIAAKDSQYANFPMANRAIRTDLQGVSALILRQGNKFWKATPSQEQFDDILTAEEIELIPFPNLNLTVLSACETGLGEVDSEGVWGLQRAFKIAGTKNLICTLREVDDYWTAQFMDTFYHQLSLGNNVYYAFQAAHCWLRAELPDNPEVWSSIILIE